MKLMKWVLLAAAFPWMVPTTVAQSTSGTTTTTERNRNATGYYVDEIGLRISGELAPEGFIDPSIYVLGSNDLLSVEVKGAIPSIWRGLIVNVMGDIVIPSVGTVNVGGLTLIEGSRKIEELVGRQFRNSIISVTLDRPKNVNVHVFGDIPSPGRYQYPARTRVDAIVIPILMGGLLDLNSNPLVQSETHRIDIGDNKALIHYDLRNIEIIDSRGQKRYADLVSYFHGGDLDANPFVLDGAQIRVFRISDGTPKISISGGVRFPFQSVFRVGDSISSLVRMAGGFSSESDSTNIVVIRKSGNSVQVLSDLSSKIILAPNDRVIVGTLTNFRGNASVWVGGEVLKPGIYPIIDGQTTVADILRLSGGMTPQAHGRSSFLNRTGEKELRRLDYDLRFQRLRRTSDQMTEGVEYLNSEFALSRRLLFLDATDSATTRRIRLYDGDRLVIPRDEGSILVFGQVNQTGYYSFRQGKTVNEYLESAGGFSLSAEKDRIFVIKTGSSAWFKPNEVSLDSGDMIFVDRVPYESLTTFRENQLQERQLSLSRNQFYLSIVTTVASLITTAIILTTR